MAGDGRMEAMAQLVGVGLEWGIGWPWMAEVGGWSTFSEKGGLDPYE